MFKCLFVSTHKELREASTPPLRGEARGPRIHPELLVREHAETLKVRSNVNTLKNMQV